MLSRAFFSLVHIKMKPGVIRVRPVAPPPAVPAPVASSSANLASQASRCAFVGDVLPGMSEGEVKDFIPSRGHPYPERALIRASAGERAGFYGMVYFQTVADAESFKNGGLTWPTGVVATTGSVHLHIGYLQHPICLDFI